MIMEYKLILNHILIFSLVNNYNLDRTKKDF